jgi:16S rRNA (cytosine967-C5)-methyltransferase
MRQAARIQSGIELLDWMQKAPIPMDNVIRDFMAKRRYIGSKDRTDIVERLYAMVRHHARLGWHIDQAGAPDTPRTRTLAFLMLHDGLSAAQTAQFFDGGKHHAEGLGPDEEQLLSALTGKVMDDPAMPVAIQVECPDWAAEKLHDVYGDQFESELRAMMMPASLDLRVNTIKTTRDEVRASLAGQGVETQAGLYSPVALRAPAKSFMGKTKAYEKGMVDIQDEGSQLIALLTGAKPGMRVLDYCAGGGGKTLAIAAMMDNKGNIVAMDNDTRRLDKGKPRYRKAGIHNVELRSLAEEQHRKWLRRQKETMDIVLVDAPCSSSGTWRRNPDLRWRQYGPSLDQIVALQAEILDKVADKVKPGGRLVYATCSLFPEENEQQVEKFLKNHPDYAVMPLEQVWDFGGKPPCAGPYLRLSPAAHGTDGFFAAVLVKK